MQDLDATADEARSGDEQAGSHDDDGGPTYVKTEAELRFEEARKKKVRA